MSLIAKRAGVAVQTVYFIFRTRDALVQEVHNQTVLGRGAPVVPPEHPWYVSMASDPDPVRAISTLVEGMHDVATILLAKAEPRPGLADRQAGDMLVALLGPEIYRTFVLELGWTREQWATWTAQTMVRELFAGQ